MREWVWRMWSGVDGAYKDGKGKREKGEWVMAREIGGEYV